MARRHTVRSNTYRFFVEPDAIRGDQVQIEDADLARQISSVLRLSPGDQILLLDGLGSQYVVTLEALGKARVTGRIEQREEAGGEPQLQITLYVGLMRAERFEWLLQKGTEIGVTAFVPVICERSAADGEIGNSKLVRWQRIIREAAEQSRRSRLPQLTRPQLFSQICANIVQPTLVLWEGQGAVPLRETLRSLPQKPAAMGILTGPEGGLSENERTVAHAHGLREVSLGPRTLRAETAPLVAATAVLYEFGEL